MLVPSLALAAAMAGSVGIVGGGGADIVKNKFKKWIEIIRETWDALKAVILPQSPAGQPCHHD